MKERPILFSAPMVRAILGGTKTQTRRIVKSWPGENCAPIFCGEFTQTTIDRNGFEREGNTVFGAHSEDGEWGERCPYGQPGDRLWVRETWQHANHPGPYEANAPVFYRADFNSDYTFDGIRRTWRPAIHMPRTASRITHWLCLRCGSVCLVVRTWGVMCFLFFLGDGDVDSFF